MMYLYVFGFRRPSCTEQMAEQDNEKDSQALFVDAPSEEAALEWGRLVSKHFVEQLFKAVGSKSGEALWNESENVNWIERKPLSRFSGMALETLEAFGAL